MNVLTFNLNRNACKLLFAGKTNPKTSDISAVISQYAEEPFPLEPFSEEIPVSERVRCNISLDAAARLTVGSLAEQLDIPPSKAVQSLVMETARRGGLRTSPEIAPPSSFALFSTSGKPIESRPEQTLCYRALLDSLKKGKIGMVEASTGSGKTIAMFTAAFDLLDKKGRLVIAVPTLAVLDHFVREYGRISLPNRKDLPFLRILVGKNEFVSKKELTHFLKAAKEDLSGAGKWTKNLQEIEDWIACGAPPASPLLYPAHWLVGSLLEIAPDFPADEVRLPRDKKDHDQDDRGYLAYREQFTSEGSDREIVLCTHAMVAMDILRRRTSIGDEGQDLLTDPRKELSDLFDQLSSLKKEGKATSRLEEETREAKRKDIHRQIEEKKERVAQIIDACAATSQIPRFDYLIVDEAHSFESSVSAALSQEVSLRGLSRKLQAAGMSKNRMNAFKKIVERIQELSLSESGDTQSLVIPRHEEATRLLHGLVALVSAFVGKTGPKRKKKTEEPDEAPPASLSEIRKILETLAKGTSPDNNIRSEIRFSPVREYPRVVFGKKTVQGDLSFLWGSLKGGACVSASLYLPTLGGVSGKIAARILAIPAGRLLENPPIVCPWIFESVESVFIPGTPGSPEFFSSRPPSRSEKLTLEQRECRMDEWVGDVAPILSRIHETAAGGTIVLLTSYERSAKFREALAPKVGEEALLVASPEFPLREQKKAFERLTRDGIRPLWLAVGSAWTGLDINGEAWGIAKEQDNILTDLVVPALPYGVNQSVTHVHRRDMAPEIPWDKYHAYMLMKQALGRLVRRSGTPKNRRIFILDGRLTDPKMKGYTSDTRSLLLPYGDRVLTLEKRGRNVRR